MSFLYNNVTVVTVAMVASVMTWLFGGTRGDLLPSVVPWLSFFMIEVLFCFPQRHRNESTYEARARVWHRLKRDSVAWISLGLLLLLLIPFVNNGLCPNCDAKLIATGVSPRPPIPFLPFCVSRLDHLNVVLWFMIALPALLLVRHGMTRRGKRMVLQLIVWNGAAVALVGFVQAATGASGPLWTTTSNLSSRPGSFFATFGYPNMAGDYFTTLFGLSVALWRNRCDYLRQERAVLAAADEADGQKVSFWSYHYFLIPAALFFFAALNTLSRAAIILVTSTAILYFVHMLISLLSRMKKARRVIVGMWSVLAFCLFAFFAWLFMPSNIQKEMHTLETTSMLDRVTGKGEHHSSTATALWQDHFLFGCGGWGYSHLGLLKLKPEDRRRAATIGGANVHNDHLQFLAEHGLVGFGAMMAIALMLLAPVYFGWKQLIKECRFKKGKDLPPKPVQVFVLPAPVFIILVTILATFIHAFSDCPLRSPAILMLYFVSMAALPGFMPKPADSGRHHHHH